MEYQPLVSLICMHTSIDEAQEYVDSQTYYNIDIVCFEENDSYEDLTEYFSSVQSKYICFYEKNHVYNPERIARMVEYLENYPQLNCCICYREFADSDGQIIAHNDEVIDSSISATAFYSKSILESCINLGINLYNDLSCLMFSSNYANSIAWINAWSEDDQINRTSLLYQILIGGACSYYRECLVTKVLQPGQSDNIEGKYISLVETFVNKGLINASIPEKPASCRGDIKKEITFFYTDKGEYYNVEPIAREAKKRGYAVKFTDEVKEEAEIGIYCQHLCYPENSKFSVILLHDMAQGHNRWPNIWERERWNKFDIGVLPGESWAKRWSRCANQYYSNPRFGAYAFGYPKSDYINNDEIKNRANELKEKFNLKYDFTILYAPSWENDGKEDEFVKSLQGLPVNLLIKQAHWPDTYSHIIANIKNMRLLHEGKFDNLYYIEPEENILVALEMCNLVVSDESSVMVEALMYNKPSIGIVDWLIPDTIPSRYASIPMDAILKCTKSELKDNVEKILDDKDYYNNLALKGNEAFSNQGNVCCDIMDAIEYYTGVGRRDDFIIKRIESYYEIQSMWN